MTNPGKNWPIAEPNCFINRASLVRASKLYGSKLNQIEQDYMNMSPLLPGGNNWNLCLPLSLWISLICECSGAVIGAVAAQVVGAVMAVCLG